MVKVNLSGCSSFVNDADYKGCWHDNPEIHLELVFH